MEPLIHILHLEDDAADAELVQALLEEAGLACRIIRVQTGEEFAAALSQGGYDLILADFRLPGYDGMSALRLVQEMGIETPFIFISGTMGEDAAIEGMREGATDYVLKQKIARLAPAVKRAIREAENRRERRRAERSLAEQFHFLQLLIDTIPSPIFYKDVNGVYLGCNQNLAEFLGRPKEEIIGETVFDIYPQEQAEKYYQMDQELFHHPGTQIYEFLMERADGAIRNFIFTKATFVDFSGKVAGLIGVMTDITERKRAEEERLAHLRFFENMDQVNRALQGTDDLEQMMSEVLGVVLSIFDCDRAWLFYPCDPEASSWRVPMERTRPEYPGAYSLGIEFPMGEDAVEALRTMLTASVPVKFGPSSEHKLPPELAQRFAYQSQIMLTLHPKVGKPWIFGLHQCSYPRVWTPEEERLLQEVGRRLTDALTSLLSYRDLRESEEKYRLLVKQIPAVVFKGYEDGSIDFFDDKIEDLAGYSKEEFCSRRLKWPDLIIPEDLPGVKDSFIEALETNRAYKQEYRIRKKSGEIAWIQARGQIFLDAAGKIDFFSGVFHDITASKQTEEELIRAKEEWELTFDSVPDLIAILDTKFRIMRVNLAMAAKLGVAPEEAVGRKCFEAVHNSPSPPQFCPHAKLMADGREHTVEVFGDNLGGDFLVTASPLRDSQGNLLGCVHIARDITERKKAEAAMAQLSRQMELILNSAGEGIFGADTEGKVTFVNPAMAQMLGWDIAELLGQFIHDLCHHTQPDGKPLPSSDCPIYLAFKDGCAYHADNEVFWRRDGTSFPVEYTSTPIREGDQVLGTVVVIKDITERKQAEEAKLKLEAQLRQAQKMEAVGTLAGGIAHDFNNILGAIIGYGEMIQMFHKSVDPKVRRDVDEILRAAFRAKDLVQQILTFSRRADQDRKPMQLQMIIKESIKFLRATLPSTIEIRQYLDPEVGPVLADPTQMQQVVMNLCTNAGHALREKGGILEIRLTEEVVGGKSEKETLGLAPGVYVRLTVRDNGHGIPQEILERIFDPYFTTKETGEGTGLGLAVVEGIVQNHGGAITAESELGVGTAFHVLIPMVERSENTFPMGPPKQIPEGRGRVLFVDDEAALADLGLVILKNLGYEVEAFTSSTAALEKFLQNPQGYDLAVVDLTMPQMTGVQLARELLQIREDLPIILSSGFGDKIPHDKVIEMGIREVIIKPWSVQALAETIKKVLD
jgi:PAS domain S-box-containing protein